MKVALAASSYLSRKIVSFKILAASTYSAFSNYGLGLGVDTGWLALFYRLAALSWSMALCKSFKGFFSIVRAADGGTIICCLSSSYSRLLD